jgi:hypothetical protein
VLSEARRKVGAASGSRFRSAHPALAFGTAAAVVFIAIGAVILVPRLFEPDTSPVATSPTTTTTAPVTTAATTTTTPVTSTTTRTYLTTDEAALHPLPADATVVVGTATCFSDQGAMVCEDDMSDPRVSGHETIGLIWYVAQGPAGTAWIASQDVITNENGTWRGTAQGAQDADGAIQGEAHFVGEGAYEGLEYHYYFGGPDTKTELRGWIFSSDK